MDFYLNTTNTELAFAITLRKKKIAAHIHTFIKIWGFTKISTPNFKFSVFILLS